MLSRVLRVQIILVAMASGAFALSGTDGSPLGGMGTGYVRFTDQTFSVSGKMPPAAVDHAGLNGNKGQPETRISSSGFSFFVNGTAKNRLKATSEDAKCPLQKADFGTISGVKFDLDAFGPYWPGEGEAKYKLATSPLALFNITAVNGGTEAAEVAVAMEFANGGLLGGANSGKIVTGNKAISFDGSTDNAYLAVDCDGASPTFSAGAAGTFESNGTLANADGNLVAAKCSIPAGGTVNFKFVLAWYRNYGQEGYYYQNFYTNSKEAAEAGVTNFDSIRVGITSFVKRLTASNFPDWYKDRLLNNTYPLVHNSVCAKDGRVAFWEGCYGIIGTIDQGQHAAVFYTFNWPSVQWQELKYWIGQQKSTGQIHHDFNQGKERFTPGSTANNRNLLPLTDKNHADYWWFPNADSWADLNCMFIFKAYELMLATGDITELKTHWPAIKKTAERLASQCGGGTKIPETSHSTYDRCQSAGTNCSYTPEYNGGIAITSFAAVAEMAKACGDEATVTTYSGYAQALRAAFKQKYGNSNDFGVNASTPNSGRFPESHVAGYSWADYFCLEPIMDEEFITKTCQKMRSKQQSGGVRANGEWIFYCVDHYGGSEIAINKPDDAMRIHKQDYDYYYQQVPKEVFWQSLQESANNTGHNSYMTAPIVWHSYFQFCGYMIDNANQRLWIRPRVPSDMKGEIKSALLLNPKALGTLNYDENTVESSGRTQLILVSYDKPVPVKELVLKNNTGTDEPFVLVNDATGPTVKPEGTGIEKRIRVTFAAPVQIGPDGMKIEVFNKPVAVGGARGPSSRRLLALNSFRLSAGSPIHFSADAAGTVTMELLTISGARIGTIMQENVAAGSQKFVWNGRTIDGRPIGSVFAVLRLTSPAGSVTKAVFTGR